MRIVSWRQRMVTSTPAGQVSAGVPDTTHPGQGRQRGPRGVAGCFAMV
ncbi:MAG TPA: hypothetical protein VGF67_29325 [Ktedonobacteraceae bacterium]